MVPHSFRCLSKGFVHGPTPAGWPPGRGALLAALCERSELGRPPQIGVRPLSSGQTGRPWFWALLPEQKGLACRGETRPYQTTH